MSSGGKVPSKTGGTFEEDWDSLPSAVAFANEGEYLEAELERMQPLVTRAIAVRNRRADEAEQLRASEQALRAILGGRVAKSEAAGQRFGLETLRRQHQLDQESVDVLLHAAVRLFDPVLAAAHRHEIGRLQEKLGLPAHGRIDVGTLLILQYDTIADRAKGRARFRAGSPLVMNDLIVLEAGETNDLLTCQVKLSANAAETILGFPPI